MYDHHRENHFSTIACDCNSLPPSNWTFWNPLQDKHSERAEEPSLQGLLGIGKILHIHQHWQECIYRGEKIWELRNAPWQHTGRIALWHDSHIAGTVDLVSCHLIALKNPDTGDWEPYDCSQAAQEWFPFHPQNMQKHCAGGPTLRDLAKTWNRMYAYVLTNPCRFITRIPLTVRKGCQKIQTMNEDSWRVCWNQFERANSNGSMETKEEEAPEKIPTDQKGEDVPKTLFVLGMSMKEALSVLEGTTSILLRSYKPRIDSPCVHVAFTADGSACIIGKMQIVDMKTLTSVQQLRQLESEGYEHNLPDTARPIKKLKEKSEVHAWILKDKILFHRPLTWKMDT